MNKIKLILKVLLIIAVLFGISFGFNLPTSAQAQVQYNPPLRSWIKYGIVQYGVIDSSEIDWAASHIDWFDGPPAANLPAIKAKTSAPTSTYEWFYGVYVGDKKYQALMNYVGSHGLNMEDMFIHFNETTERRCNDSPTGTYTFPAGSRVPNYPGCNGGNLTANDARVTLNLGNPNLRAFYAEYDPTLLNNNGLTWDGATYDGLYVDNGGPNVLGTVALGYIVSGGGIVEYPGSRSVADAEYTADLLTTFQNVSAVLRPNGKKIFLNLGYDSWPDVYPYVDGILRERALGQNPDGPASFYAGVNRLQEEAAIGMPSYLTSATDGTDRYNLNVLEMYYLRSTPFSYFGLNNWYGSHYPREENYFPAVEYNVGQPKNNVSQFATGIDPSSPSRATGTGTLSISGALYTLTDNSKSWAANQWQGQTLVDSAGNSFGVYSSAANSITVYRQSAPYPVGGYYELGTYPYWVYHREFDNVLVIYKIKGYQDTQTGDPSATTHDLRVTTDNPSGRYYKLAANGTVENTPLTQITLRNVEGAILVKESALTGVNISKTVSASSAKSGDTLTYTITYTNGNQTNNNVKIEDPIPTGTTFVQISGGPGSYSDATKLITWDLEDLIPGQTGQVSFQVRIE